MCKVPALLAVLVLPLYPCALRGQSTNASLTGRVTDPSKAAIAEAKVAAINTGTNFHYEAATNLSGEYFLANLPPGTYRIEVEKPGFKKLIQPDLALHVQDTREINFEMTLGSATDAITVSDVLPVETESATVSTVVNHTFVENLPLNGRSFQTLIMLTPGVVVTQTAAADQGQFSVNGQRADANYFTVDGVSANFGVTGDSLLVQVAGGSLTCPHGFRRHEQPRVRGCHAGVSCANVFVCRGVRAYTGRSDFHRDPLRDEQLFRSASCSPT